MSASRLSLFATLAAVLALARMFFIGALFGVGPISIGLQIVAFLFMVWARLTFGMRSFHAAADTTVGELVTRGPYAIVRNPIYAAVILFAWTGAAVHFSLESALLALVVFAGMFTRILIEERFLRRRYSDYEAYTKRVKRLVPFVF
ncbi:MAG TPA: isoprenylcysteine carboxylmethyltransferase family protein [Planctomycetota bacterium]|nr:isoprenylcysteine carboxylmethyltransferase family protein [Planctomycetota bacterium]